MWADRQGGAAMADDMQRRLEQLEAFNFIDIAAEERSDRLPMLSSCRPSVSFSGKCFINSSNANKLKSDVSALFLFWLSLYR